MNTRIKVRVDHPALLMPMPAVRTVDVQQIHAVTSYQPLTDGALLSLHDGRKVQIYNACEVVGLLMMGCYDES